VIIIDKALRERPPCAAMRLKAAACGRRGGLAWCGRRAIGRRRVPVQAGRALQLAPPVTARLIYFLLRTVLR